MPRLFKEVDGFPTHYDAMKHLSLTLKQRGKSLDDVDWVICQCPLGSFFPMIIREIAAVSVLRPVQAAI